MSNTHHMVCQTHPHWDMADDISWNYPKDFSNSNIELLNLKNASALLKHIWAV